VLEQHLLVLCVVVLGVLGDVAELARDTDPLGDLASPDGRELLDFVLQPLVASGVRMTSFTANTLLTEKRRRWRRRRGREW
jgi:hypothetical protein